MKETPHPDVLNREKAASVAADHFSRQTALLRDLADYGSNLFIRAFNSSAKNMEAVIVCGVLLKQVVAMIDAVEVLIVAGCGHAAFLPARTAFEASVYLDWILENQSERRATRYLVGNYRDERLWADRATPGTDEAAAMNRITSMLGFDVHTNRPMLAADATQHRTEIDRILSQPNLQVVDEEFTVARGRRRRDPEWYELDGLKSIRQVADRVGRLPEYEFFYSKGSQVAHTGSYKDHLRFRSKKVHFLPIRHLADVNMLINFTCSIALGTYKKVLERYRPGENAAFGKKYLEDWQEPFKNVTTIRYDFYKEK